jgi:hypothetical protein
MNAARESALKERTEEFAPQTFEQALSSEQQADLTETGRFRWVEVNPGTYRLTAVAVSSEGLKSAPRHWIVEVRPQEADIKKQEVGIGKAEVLDWLEIYRRAWEKRSVDTLVRLGEVTSQHAPKLREVLLDYKDFRVALKDVQIRIEGAQATVTLRRVDIIDGKALPQPDRKVFVLEKQTDGRLVRRGAK